MMKGRDTMDRSELRKIVIAKTGKRGLTNEVMRVLGCNKNTAYLRASGRSKWKADEIEKFRIEYGLSDEQVVDIFIKD